MTELENNLGDWERYAEDLLDLDQSDETKKRLESDIIEIHGLLERKILEEEDKFEAEIKAETDTIQNLKQRISESQAGSIGNEELMVHDPVSLYQSIKHQEWFQVYQILTEQTKDSEAVICAKLINILKECYSVCEQKIWRTCEEIKHEVQNPGASLAETPRNKQQPKQKGKGKTETDELSRFTEELLKKTGAKIFSSHKLKLLADVASSKVHKAITAPVLDTKVLQEYMTKCLEFAWFQILENKEVKIEDNLKNLSKLSPKYKNNPNRMIVAWPALVDGNRCVVSGCDAELIDKNAVKLQPDKKQNIHPGESKLQAESNMDKNVAETEKEVIDTEKPKKSSKEERDISKYQVDNTRLMTGAKHLPINTKDQSQKMTGWGASGPKAGISDKEDNELADQNKSQEIKRDSDKQGHSNNKKTDATKEVQSSNIYSQSAKGLNF